jgi:ubiquinone/menaquinone biosynthesis methyltransferase
MSSSREAPAAIYTPAFVQGLFNEMSATYGIINLITSFGFSARWRKQCVAEIPIGPQDTVLDLMSGMGELWPTLTKTAPRASITGIDFSSAMCAASAATAHRLPHPDLKIIERDALRSGLDSSSVDVIVSSFGLKTFSPPQHLELAKEMARLLRPGGVFSMLEISVPASNVLRIPYMFYLKQIIPLLGKLLMGNPDNYRMLGVYTTAFQNCRGFAEACKSAGFEIRYASYFFGCATGVVGKKPAGG